MIGYGLAFVVGYLLVMAVDILSMEKVVPWSPTMIIWGLVFMALNWIAGQG